MKPLQKIEAKAEKFAAARNELNALLADLESDVEAAKKQHMKGIRAAFKKVAKARDSLHSVVEAHPEAFEKPKTRTFHEIKVGFQRVKEALVLPETEKLITRIKAQFSKEKVEMLIKTTEAPIKSALSNLTSSERRKCLIKTESAHDVVFIKPSGGDVEKFANAVLDG